MLIKNKPASISMDAVFKTLDVFKESEQYEEYCELFKEIEKIAIDICEPRGVYEIKENPKHGGELLEMDKYSHIVYVTYTAGEKLSEYVSNYFNEGLYLEGMMLDHIADQIVGFIDKELSESIFSDLKTLNFGQTKRFSPGEQISIEFQSLITRETFSAELIGVKSKESHLLDPVKSGSFILWCDSSLELLPISSFRHDCSTCKFNNCKWRKV